MNAPRRILSGAEYTAVMDAVTSVAALTIELPVEDALYSLRGAQNVYELGFAGRIDREEMRRLDAQAGLLQAAVALREVALAARDEAKL